MLETFYFAVVLVFTPKKEKILNKFQETRPPFDGITASDCFLCMYQFLLFIFLYSYRPLDSDLLACEALYGGVRTYDILSARNTLFKITGSRLS